MASPNEKMYAPTLYETFYCTVLGAILLVLGVLLSSVKDYDLRNYNFFSTSVRTFVDSKLTFLETPRWSTTLTFLLWTTCGILVYIAIWFVSSIIRSYRDDSYTLHGFLTPKGFNRGDEIFTVIARGLIRFVALLSVCSWLIFLIRTVTPYLTKVFATSLSPFTYRTIPSLLVSSFLLGAGIFLLIVLLRFVFLRKRLFSSSVIG